MMTSGGGETRSGHLEAHAGLLPNVARWMGAVDFSCGKVRRDPYGQWRAPRPSCDTLWVPDACRVGAPPGGAVQGRRRKAPKSRGVDTVESH